VHVLGQRYRSYAERQMAAAIEALPSGNGLVFELLKIESKQRRAFLDEIASTTGGILAMLPTRHNFISRLLAMMSDYEKFMIEGPLPILALPRNGALPTSIERILFRSTFRRAPTTRSIRLPILRSRLAPNCT